MSRNPSRATSEDGRRTRRTLLHPVAGRRLARELKPARAAAAAAAMPRGLHDPAFARLVERIEDDVFHEACTVDVYFDGEDAFAAMLAAVEAARSEVLLESYIFKDDPTGRRFQKALLAAAGRGVSVRVLADGVGSIETRESFWRELRDGNVEARVFHPIRFPIRLWKQRDHRKILVADREIAFTGGMNIGDEYGSSLLPRESIWRDTHACVRGGAAVAMAAVFEEAWVEAGGAPLPPAAAAPETPGEARVLVLDSRPGRGQEEVSSVFASIAGAARSRLWITMAYFAPRTRALTILGGAAARGVDVRLLLPGRTDIAIVRHAGHGFFSGLLRRGVRVFEYEAAVLHAKTFVADGYASVIGSSNLDFRSFELNAECNFLVLDEALGRRMEARFNEDLAHACEVRLAEWRSRGALHRAGDHLARRFAPIL